MRVHEERDLDILQVTINNVCNLKCPHCYLNVAGTGMISSEVIEKIFEEPPAKVAIVGMEPLHDPRSTAIVREIARRGRETETHVSMVTNGLGFKFLRGLAAEELPDLIDISLDGGPEFYRRFRGDGKDHFPKIREGAVAFQAENPHLPVNILHTLFAENTTPEIIEDMIEGGRMVAPQGEILFSPYIPPFIQTGERQAESHALGLRQLLEIVRRSSAFMTEPKALLFAGPYNAEAFGLSIEEFIALVKEYGLEEKARIDTGVPHLNGGLRVLYDGYAIRPDYSIHTSLYEKYKVLIADKKLADIYREFQSLPSAFATLSRR